MSTSPTKITSKVFRLDQLPESQKTDLTDQMIGLDDQIFEDLTKEKTRKMFKGESTDESWALLIWSGSRLVGYNAIQIYYLEAEGKKFALWNSRSGIATDFRGLGQTGTFAIKFFFRFRTRHPFLPVYSLLNLIHPSSFRLFANRIPDLYPFPLQELPPRLQSIYDRAYQRLGLTPIEAQPRFVNKITNRTRTEAIEVDFWTRDPHPAIQFFHEHNKEYMDRQAITVFFPLNLIKIFQILWRTTLLKRGAVNLWALLGLQSEAKKRRKILEQIPLLDHLSPTLLKALSETLKTKTLSPNEILFQQGSVSRTMYVILKGSLFVDLETRIGTLPIAQLQIGEPVGEFGFLFGSPRNATIRSFQNTQLMVIDPKQLKDLMKDHPSFKMEILDVIARRMADNHLRQTPAFTEMSHAARLELVRNTPLTDLPEGKIHRCDDNGELILVTGQLESQGECIMAPKTISYLKGQAFRVQDRAVLLSFSRVD